MPRARPRRSSSAPVAASSFRPGGPTCSPRRSGRSAPASSISPRWDGGGASTSSARPTAPSPSRSTSRSSPTCSLAPEPPRDTLEPVEQPVEEASRAPVERAVVEAHRLLEVAISVRARRVLRPALAPAMEDERVRAVVAVQAYLPQLPRELVLLPVHAGTLVEAADREELLPPAQHRGGAHRVHRSRHLA